MDQLRIAATCWRMADGGRIRLRGWHLGHGACLLPEWALAAVLGLVIGVILRKKWMIGAILCALAYLIPCDLMLFMVGQSSSFSLWGPEGALELLLWRTPAFALMCSAAYFASGGKTVN